MATKQLKITSVLGGHSPAYNAYGQGQFLTSVGIDPERVLSSSIVKQSGMIVPTRYRKVSESVMDGRPNWFIVSPKKQLVYVYAQNGDFYSYSQSLGSETLIGVPTSGGGEGAASYNNYIYLATSTDVSRYGPLNGSAALANNFWTSTLSKTALSSSYDSQSYTNAHAMHVHEGKLYFCDYIDGYGMIHFIKTTKSSAEGDTNDGSTYNALDLPYGYKPVDIESFGTDLAILAVQESSGQGFTQGNAALFLWDTFSSSWYRQVDLPFNIANSLVNRNGKLLIFGTTGNALQIVEYYGGYSVTHIASLPGVTAPLQGAIDVNGNRVAWGSRITYPVTAACVFTLGYENPSFSPYAINNIGRCSTASTNSPTISALRYDKIGDNVGQPVLGWYDEDGNEGIDDIGTSATSFNSVWRSQVFNIGQRFTIKRVRMPMGVVVAANMTVTPKIYLDNEVTNTTLRTINSTQYVGSTRLVDDFTPVHGHHSFFLELNFTGTEILPIGLPITITIETQND